jgi:hypothetical protein
VSLIDRAGRRIALSPDWRVWWNLSWSQATEEVFFAARGRGAFGLQSVSLAGRDRLVTRIPGDFEVHDVDPRGRLLLERRFRRGVVVGVPPGESRERDLSWLDFTGAMDLSAHGRQLLLGGWSVASAGTEGTYLRKTAEARRLRFDEESAAKDDPFTITSA